MNDDEVIWIDLDKIVNDDDSYTRLRVDPATVRHYATLLEMGIDLRPIEVAPLGDGRYRNLDGRHRYDAHRLCGKTRIRARPKEVPAREWIVYQLRANRAHGKPYTEEDKAWSAKLMIKQGYSINEAAREVQLPRSRLEQILARWERPVVALPAPPVRRIDGAAPRPAHVLPAAGDAQAQAAAMAVASEARWLETLREIRAALEAGGVTAPVAEEIKRLSHAYYKANHMRVRRYAR